MKVLGLFLEEGPAWLLVAFPFLFGAPEVPELEPPFNNGGYLEVKPQRKVTTDHDVNFLLKAPMSSFVMTHGPSRGCAQSLTHGRLGGGL